MSSYWWIFILFITSCSPQTFPAITEPKLVSVVPINSTALTIAWQFASSAYDQSDFININLVITEFYYTYQKTYPTISYQFTKANKTITNLTINFELVNAYYYVCFSSNSSEINVSQYVLSINNCQLTRTCLRTNSSICPGPSTVSVQATTISSSSVIISFLWPNDLPYNPLNFSVILISTGQQASAQTVIQNSSYTVRPYQLTGLQALTSYTVNTSFTYNILNISTTTNISALTVRTSSSSSVFSNTCDLFFFSMIILLVKIKTNL